MTTIGSTSYYAATNRYAGSDRSSGVGDATGSEAKGGKAASPTQYGAESAIDGRPSSSSVSLQGKLFTLSGIDSSKAKPINISELPEDEYQSFIESDQRSLEANKRSLENQHTDWSWTATVEASLKVIPVSPATQPYATVVRGGEVIATIDNQGVVTSSDDLSKKLQGKLSDDLDGTGGPNLAQVRAREIADLLGGRVEKAPTAMTQSQFNALPPIEQPQVVIDYEAMKKDPMYQQLQKMSENLQKIQDAREEYLAKRQTGIE